MKTLVTSVLIGLLSTFMTPINVFSQDIDANRMNRDIRIMENILGELFRTQISPSGTGSNSTFVVSGFGSLSPRNIRGTYLTGYGVIFMVSNTNFFTYRAASQSGDGAVSFYYDGENTGESREVSVESVTERITEFLKDYGSTIGQLKNDENVMVIYGSKSNLDVQFVRLARAGQTTDDDEKTEPLPVISVSAKAGDLKGYRTGSINESTFENRVAVATSEDKEYLDLKVMSNIFQTALREQDEDSFRLSGSVNYLMLDNFGALFSLDVRFSNRSSFGATVWQVESARRVARDAGIVSSDLDEAEEKIEEQKVKAQEAYKELIKNVKEYIVDYGRTLSSLSNEQYLLLSVNVNGRFEEIPERFDVQVKKSVLSNLDRGSITRENALNQVMVTEY